MHTFSIDFNQLVYMEVEHYQVIICKRLATFGELWQWCGYNEICLGRQLHLDVRFSNIQELTLSPYSGCAGGLVEPKVMTRCSAVCCVYLRLPRHKVECDSSGWWEASKGCCTCSFCVFSQIEFHVLCLVGVLLQLTFLSGHCAGVLRDFGIWCKLSLMSGLHTLCCIHTKHSTPRMF